MGAYRFARSLSREIRRESAETWTGLAAVRVIIGGMILFGDRIAPVQAGFVALIVVGVVGTKLFAPG